MKGIKLCSLSLKLRGLAKILLPKYHTRPSLVIGCCYTERRHWYRLAHRLYKGGLIVHFCNRTTRNIFYEGRWNLKGKTIANLGYELRGQKGYIFINESLTELIEVQTTEQLTLESRSLINLRGIFKLSWQLWGNHILDRLVYLDQQETIAIGRGQFQVSNQKGRNICDHTVSLTLFYMVLFNGCTWLQNANSYVATSIAKI